VEGTAVVIDRDVAPKVGLALVVLATKFELMVEDDAVVESRVDELLIATVTWKPFAA
jgi:hypothetical protein